VNKVLQALQAERELKVLQGQVLQVHKVHKESQVHKGSQVHKESRGNQAKEGLLLLLIGHKLLFIIIQRLQYCLMLGGVVLQLI